MPDVLRLKSGVEVAGRAKVRKRKTPGGVSSWRAIFYPSEVATFVTVVAQEGAHLTASVAKLHNAPCHILDVAAVGAIMEGEPRGISLEWALEGTTEGDGLGS